MRNYYEILTSSIDDCITHSLLSCNMHNGHYQTYTDEHTPTDIADYMLFSTLIPTSIETWAKQYDILQNFARKWRFLNIWPCDLDFWPQGHPRSKVMVPTESPHISLYKLIILTICLSLRIKEIWRILWFLNWTLTSRGQTGHLIFTILNRLLGVTMDNSYA